MDRDKILDKFDLVYVGLFDWSYLPLSEEKFPHILIKEKMLPFLLIGSSSNLQVTMAGMKSHMTSNSSQIGQFALELLAL